MIEDYFLADDTELCPEDQQRLKDDVSVPNGAPITETRLRELLEANGLVVEEFVDMTDRWCTFIWERYVIQMSHKNTAFDCIQMHDTMQRVVLFAQGTARRPMYIAHWESILEHTLLESTFLCLAPGLTVLAS